MALSCPISFCLIRCSSGNFRRSSLNLASLFLIALKIMYRGEFLSINKPSTRGEFQIPFFHTSLKAFSFRPFHNTRTLDVQDHFPEVDRRHGSTEV